jgi:hypothetical protein
MAGHPDGSWVVESADNIMGDGRGGKVRS